MEIARNGEAVAMIKVSGDNTEVDNHWVVPYSPILLQMFDCHINVEYSSNNICIKK